YSESPVAFVATYNEDFSFIPYESHVQPIYYSRYRVGGESSPHQSQDLKAYLFSDRGIYRPGEKINMGMIIKGQDWGANLKDIPIEVVVTNPRGLTIKRGQDRLSSLGFEEFDFSTTAASPTGKYTISAYLIKKKSGVNRRGDRIGSATIKVEEFLPDRMKIAAKFSKLIPRGWVSPKDLKGLVNLQNLFGVPAVGHRVQATLNLQPSYPRFRSYRDYTFHDPLRSENHFSETLQAMETGNEGNAEFDLQLNKFDEATYKLEFFASGFELDGGRSVSASTSILVSPLDYLIGY
ncbi:MAG: alpha-2-macroglobulin family protein, partial [Proteobacteria bacterium]|nr:alpha-2-macroglobulin family protein [Pseudomonadota bacterium]